MPQPAAEIRPASERFELREEIWSDIQKAMRMSGRQRAIVTLAINGVPDPQIAMTLRLPMTRVHVEWMRLQLRNRTVGKASTLAKFLMLVAEIHHRPKAGPNAVRRRPAQSAADRSPAANRSSAANRSAA